MFVADETYSEVLDDSASVGPSGVWPTTSQPTSIVAGMAARELLPSNMMFHVPGERVMLTLVDD